MSTSVVQKIANAGGVGIPVSLTTSTGATTTEGILLAPSNTATLNNQKWSPSIHFQGSQWVSGGVNAAQTQDVKIELVPLQQTSAYLSSQLYFRGGFADGSYANSFIMDFDAAAFKVGTTVSLGFNSLSIQGATTPVTLSSLNGAQWIRAQVSEQLTLSTSGTTTDTTASLLPADAIIEAVVARVTTTITTATSWQLGDPTTAGRFSAANSTMTAGATIVGTVHADQTGAAGPRQATAAKVRVTTVGTPGAGVVRITVFYRQFVAPTS